MPQPKDKGWLNGYKNKTPIYARDPPQNKGHIQTKSEGLEKNKYFMQMETKRKQEPQKCKNLA